ncbi:alpha/beta hydrolase [Nocardioides rubriscoriae]|uniref:alpha/beta hydrolase n=1 Tax=Nocardioides rubriscoriae TaxID=642762 RepID=UPI0011DFE733|nr:alpha/beta hydrolase [Nocardioides rubriscoriae]
MTAVPLPPFPRPLRRLSVDASPIADFATGLLAASARLDDTGELARGAGRLLDWVGVAAETYRGLLAPYGHRADAMSLALRGVARRVDDHGDRMARLRAELDDLGAANRALVDETFVLVDDVRAFHARESLLGAAALAELRHRSADLTRRVHALDARQDRWWTRVGAEEQAMIDAFTRVLEVEQAESRYGGAADPADAALATRPGPDAGPGEVLAWWRGLTRAQRLALVAAAPGAIGDLDGVPAVDRDAANRVRLSRDLATLRHLEDLGQLTLRERETLDNAEAVEEALDRHSHDVDAHGHRVPVLLWIYDPGAYVQDDGGVDGRVAVAVGDPDTADAVAINVPGIKTEADDIGTYTDRAWELHQAATTADPDRDYASIAWIGYDAPAEVDGVDAARTAASAGAAHHGGALLAESIDGLRAVRGSDADIVPIGHSYGSVALGAALSEHHVDVDRAVAVGSPGLGEGIDDVGDLDVPRGQLYVGQNHDDAVAGLGQNGALGLGGLGHGQDPADDGFGGVRFQANAGPGHDDHSGYYDNDSESLHNLGEILAGHDPTLAGSVHDPWWGPALDPEDQAPSDLYDTDGDGDTDGIPRR